MAVQATNYDGTREYEVAEVKDVYRPNLLINGDFQCNQRGEPVYDFGQTLSYGYTLDMWYSARVKVTKFNAPSEWIQLDNKDNTSHVFKQRINLKNSTKYTFTTWVAQPTGTVKISLERQGETGIDLMTLKKGRNEVTFTSPANSESTQLAICFVMGVNSSIGVLYANLFEGDIAYPRVKEDYNVALARCQQYLKCYRDPALFIASVDSGSQYVCETIVDSLMTKYRPTLIQHGRLYGYGTAGGVDIVGTSLGYISLSSGRLLIKFEADKHKSFGTGRSNVVVLGNPGDYIEITCEPL